MPSETGITSILGAEKQINKNQPNGYAGLDANTLLPESRISKTAFTSGIDIYHSHDAEVTTGNDTYTKVKTITLGHLPNSVLKIGFEIHSSYWGAVTYAKIYRNGGAVGTERTAYDNYEEFTEIISGWSKDDTLELWIRSPLSGYTAYARNFRIYYTATVALSNS